MKFVIFHDAFGDPEENWFPQLKKDLESAGQSVIVPKFPIDDWNEVINAGPTVPNKNQNLQNWLQTFEPITKTFLPTDELCFIGHSLGPVFILHAVTAFNLHLNSAIFVSPFMSSLHSEKYWQFDHVNNSFYKTDFDFKKLKMQIPFSYVLYSDTDPYVGEKYSSVFAQAMGSSIMPVMKAGHISDKMYAPLIFELCKTRLDQSKF
jgi:predicted alpha/beta hydrolase family esterase